MIKARQILNKLEAIATISQLAASETPFFFFTDFEGLKTWICPTSEINPQQLRFAFHECEKKSTQQDISLSKDVPSFESFKLAFDQVVNEINIGNSFLVNLTFKTPIKTNRSLSEIYESSKAKYKVWFDDQFVVFSPETFVKIIDGEIFSYPMKGTIDASIENAKEKILSDPKETAEHVTITDLIRNDLSQVAEKVTVSQFRFITEVTTHEKTLLQVSSEIKGTLAPDWKENLGELLFALLPAGSICGAPKPKTVAIIKAAENYERGFYTGICGHFDGQNLDTGVMIRFIEKENNQLYYKSGGGITSFSDAQSEYQEIIDKIYVPIY